MENFVRIKRYARLDFYFNKHENKWIGLRLDSTLVLNRVDSWPTVGVPDETRLKNSRTDW